MKLNRIDYAPPEVPLDHSEPIYAWRVNGTILLYIGQRATKPGRKFKSWLAYRPGGGGRVAVAPTKRALLRDLTRLPERKP